MSRVNGVDKWMSGGRLPALSVEAVLEEDVSIWKSELVDRSNGGQSMERGLYHFRLDGGIPDCIVPVARLKGVRYNGRPLKM